MRHSAKVGHPVGRIATRSRFGRRFGSSWGALGLGIEGCQREAEHIECFGTDRFASSCCRTGLDAVPVTIIVR